MLFCGFDFIDRYGRMHPQTFLDQPLIDGLFAFELLDLYTPILVQAYFLFVIISFATAMLLLSFLPGVSEFGHGTHVCRDLCRRRETVGLHFHPQMAVPVERHAAESPAAGLVQDNGPCQLLGIGQPLGIGRLPEPNPLIGCDRLDPLQVVV